MTEGHENAKGRWTSPSFVTFVHPFCIIRPDDEDDFTVPLDEINANSYNHGLLCRIVAALHAPQLGETPLLLCADGAIAAPAIPSLRELSDVLDIFNGVMCSLLLGGHLCEAVDSRDIVHGNLHERRAIWPTDLGQSLNAYLHSTMRMKIASTTDTICLSNPKNVSVSQFFRHYAAGRAILDGLPNVSPTLLLRGYTEMRYQNLVDSLSNLWIVVEQITDFLWGQKFLENPDNHPDVDIPNRRRSLTADNRTWSTSVRQEMLYQQGILPAATYAKLYPARKARNDLVHEGRRPSADIVGELFAGVLDLVEIATGIAPNALMRLDTREQDMLHPRNEYDLAEWKETASEQSNPRDA